MDRVAVSIVVLVLFLVFYTTFIIIMTDQYSKSVESEDGSTTENSLGGIVGMMSAGVLCAGFALHLKSNIGKYTITSVNAK
jgi:hypothetical protein